MDGREVSPRRRLDRSRARRPARRARHHRQPVEAGSRDRADDAAPDDRPTTTAARRAASPTALWSRRSLRPVRGSSGLRPPARPATCSPRHPMSAGRRRTAATSCSAVTGCGSRRRTPIASAVPDGDGLDVDVRTGRHPAHRRPEEPDRPRAFDRPPLCHPAPTLTVPRTRNVGDRPVELAPWSITQLPLGGRVLLPQRPAARGHSMRPNRTLVLWPYTSWEDPRFRSRDGLLALDATPAATSSSATSTTAGWVAYVRDGVARATLRPAPGSRIPTSDATSRRTSARAMSSSSCWAR